MLAWLAVCATLAPLAAAGLNCPAGYEDKQLGDNRCYMFSSENRTWTMAYTSCLTSAEGGNLVSILGPNGFYPVSFFVSAGGRDAWTGLLNFAGDTRSWADGARYDPALDAFFAAEPGSGLNGYVSASDGLLHLSDGGEPRGYVCYVDLTPPVTTTTQVPTTTEPTTPPPPPCESGWRQYGDLCYLFSSEQQYWSSAAHACHAAGAELVSIHDPGVLTFLLLSAGQETYWTGLENQGDVYVWEDGSDASDAAALLGPYMDEWSEGRDCLALNATSFPQVLAHLSCLSEQNYICAKPAVGAGYFPAIEEFIPWL